MFVMLVRSASGTHVDMGDPMTVNRTHERTQFLADVLVTAIEHCGYGFPGIVKYEPMIDGDSADTYAVIYDRYAEEEYDTTEDVKRVTYLVTIDTIAKGFGIIGKMKANNDLMRDLMLANRTNGDDGDVDVIGALAVLECALFGDVVYC